MVQPRLHPYYEMVLRTRPVYLFDAGVRNVVDGTSGRPAWNLSSRRDASGNSINGDWAGTRTPSSNVRLPRGLRGAARTLVHPDSAGTRGYIVPNNTGIINNHGFCMAGWVYVGTSGRGSLIKVGGATDGWSIGVGSGTHETSGNDVIALFEAVRWIAPGWNGLTGGRWHFIALWINPADSGTPHIYADGAWRSTASGTAPKLPSNPGRCFSSTVNDTVRTINLPAFAPTFWHVQHPGNQFPFSDSTRALAELNRLYAAGLKGLYPKPNHRRAVLVA